MIAYIRDLTKQPSSTKRAQEHLATEKTKPVFNPLCELTKMASTQSHNKPAAKEGSLGQKVSEIAGFLKGGHHGEHNSSSHTTSTQYGLATPATNGQHGLNQHHATGTKKRGERKNNKTGGSRNLLQKIKDGISGHSSESDSSSSSESENEGYQKKASDLSVYQ